MSKYTTQGNCPYCDGERGITTVWGMSPAGMMDLKRRHDEGHPENTPTKEARIEKLEAEGIEIKNEWKQIKVAFKGVAKEAEVEEWAKDFGLEIDGVLADLEAGVMTHIEARKDRVFHYTPGIE